jgi:hypothetical protein
MVPFHVSGSDSTMALADFIEGSAFTPEACSDGAVNSISAELIETEPNDQYGSPKNSRG